MVHQALFTKSRQSSLRASRAMCVGEGRGGRPRLAGAVRSPRQQVGHGVVVCGGAQVQLPHGGGHQHVHDLQGRREDAGTLLWGAGLAVGPNLSALCQARFKPPPQRAAWLLHRDAKALADSPRSCCHLALLAGQPSDPPAVPPAGFWACAAGHPQEMNRECSWRQERGLRPPHALLTWWLFSRWSRGAALPGSAGCSQRSGMRSTLTSPPAREQACAAQAAGHAEPVVGVASQGAGLRSGAGGARGGRCQLAQPAPGRRLASTGGALPAPPSPPI